MNYKNWKKNVNMVKFITDLLYADMESGDVGFIETAYRLLGLYDNKRLVQTGKKCRKISSEVKNAAYETVICIVVKEICSNGNESLWEAFLEYYLKKFPYVKERVENCGNDAEKLFNFYKEGLNRKKFGLTDFAEQSFVFLYMVSCGNDKTANMLIEMWDGHPREHYKRMDWRFYEKLDSIEESIQWLENRKNIELYDRAGVISDIVSSQRTVLALKLGIEPDMLEECIIRSLLGRKSVLCDGRKHIGWDLAFLDAYDYMNDILKKYHMNPLALKETEKTEYIGMLKKIFKGMCMEDIYNGYYKESHNDLYIVEQINTIGLDDTRAFLGEWMSRFLFECHMKHQQGMWDEYYKLFSFCNEQENSSKLLERNYRLEEELCQCKKKLQQYADADSERRRKENKVAKRIEQQYIEKIASLEKKLEEYEKEMVQKKEMLADRDTYIDLLETENDLKTCEDEVDVSKLYSHRILFVGGRPEMVSRLKSVFSTATFVGIETMTVPQKTDLIVLLTGYMNHALYYKYISLARVKGIKVTYCNGSNIESITTQVVGCL